MPEKYENGHHRPEDVSHEAKRFGSSQPNEAQKNDTQKIERSTGTGEPPKSRPSLGSVQINRARKMRGACSAEDRQDRDIDAGDGGPAA